MDQPYSLNPTSAPVAQEIPTNLPTIEDVLHTRISTLRHIPKAVRNDLSLHFTRILENISHHPDSVIHWTYLLLFPKCVLFAPSRGGKMHFRERQDAIRKKTLHVEGGADPRTVG
jgi:hypothetical protein